MSFCQKQTISVTTDASGDATVYSSPVSGKIAQVYYVKAGSGNFDDGVDFAITVESTGEGVWTENNVNASAGRAPRLATHTNAGAAALYAAGGVAVLDHIRLANDRVKFVISSGGDTKNGSFILVME